eukprot:COSAG02_NODE_3538_length_6591_cov_2.343038_5_plen_184_part_00
MRLLGTSCNGEWVAWPAVCLRATQFRPRAAVFTRPRAPPPVASHLTLPRRGISYYYYMNISNTSTKYVLVRVEPYHRRKFRRYDPPYRTEVRAAVCPSRARGCCSARRVCAVMGPRGMREGLVPLLVLGLRASGQPVDTGEWLTHHPLHICAHVRASHADSGRTGDCRGSIGPQCAQGRRLSL